MSFTSGRPFPRGTDERTREGRFHRGKTPSGRPVRRGQVLPRLESLEDRTVPSTLTVTSGADDGSSGTLRSVLATANPGDTIQFSKQLNGQTITLAQGQLAIAQSVSIAGPGADKLAVSGNDASRVFDITGGAAVNITGLAIVHGLADQGGGILSEPGATLTVSQCVFAANRADGGSTGTGYGGGILNEGRATVAASAFSGNTSTGGGAGYGSGGGISNLGPGITISNCSFDQNQAIDGLGVWAEGGAVDNQAGTMRLAHDRFTGNQALGTTTFSYGGALDTYSPDQTASISVHDCDFTGNLSSARGLGTGGAIAIVGPATLANCTFTGNRAIGLGFGAQGGAIDSESATTTATNCVFTSNKAIGGNNSFTVFGGAIDSIFA
jgi:hypothetical protein